MNQRIRMKLSIIHFKEIGLLEVSNSHLKVQLPVFRLETTRGPINERGWRKVLLYQVFLRGGEILITFLIYKMVILQGRTSDKLDCQELKVQPQHEQVCVGKKARK